MKRVPTRCYYINSDPVPIKVELMRFFNPPLPTEQRIGTSEYVFKENLNVCFFQTVWYYPEEALPIIQGVLKSIFDEAGTHNVQLLSKDLKNAAEIIHSFPLSHENSLEDWQKDLVKFSFLILYAFCGVLRDVLHGKVNEAIEFLSVPYLRHCLLILMSQRNVDISKAAMIKIWLKFVFQYMIKEEYAVMFEITRPSYINTIFNDISTPSAFSISKKAIYPKSMKEWESFCIGERAGQFHSPQTQLRVQVEADKKKRIAASKSGTEKTLIDFTRLHRPRARAHSETIEKINALIFPTIASKSQRKRNRKKKKEALKEKENYTFIEDQKDASGNGEFPKPPEQNKMKEKEHVKSEDPCNDDGKDSGIFISMDDIYP